MGVSQPRRQSNGELAGQVKSILASKNLTLYQVSEKTAALFGRGSPYYIPHNLYYDLRHDSFSPSLFQLFAFSRISDYRLTDWLQTFGFDIEVIPRLQIQLLSRRTILLDSSLDDPSAFIPWLRNSSSGGPPADVVPLSRVLEWTKPRRLTSLSAFSGKGVLYAKIGDQDSLAFPELLPGSIVRLHPRRTDDLPPERRSEPSKELYLVEHAKGLYCCHIRAIGDGRIAAISSHLPYAEAEFKVPDEARLVGVVDLEFRGLLRPQQPSVAKEFAHRWKAQAWSPEPARLGPLLRRARLRAGLSFRAASAITREVAERLGDERYFIAAGSLSDYETFNHPPRHFHKLVTFSATYSLPLTAMLATLGLSLQNAGHEPIPRLLTGRTPPEVSEGLVGTDKIHQAGFFEEALAEFGEVPFFLRQSIQALCGLPNPSLKDFFWIGGARSISHPYLAGGLLAVVNRHKKKLNDCSSKSLWQQPLYIILKRDGTYLCGCCSRENASLVVHSYPGGLLRRDQFRNRDVEVIGKIVLVVRKPT